MPNFFSLSDKLELTNIEFFKALYGCKTMRLKGAWLLWSDILPERFCNLTVAIRSNQRDAPGLISQASGKFKENGIDPGFQITPATRPKNFASLLTSFGFKKSYSESWMIRQEAIEIPRLKEINIIKVQTRKEMQRFIELFNNLGNNLPKSEKMDRAYESVLWNSFKKKQYRRKIKHYLVILNQKPVGFGTLAVTKNYASIYNIGVLEPLRGRGIGSTLINQLISDALKLEIKKIFLQTNPGSLAQKFFKKAGFKPLFVAEAFEEA